MLCVCICLHTVLKTAFLFRQDGASRPQGNSTISGLRGHSQGAIISYNVCGNNHKNETATKIKENTTKTVK